MDTMDLHFSELCKKNCVCLGPKLGTNLDCKVEFIWDCKNFELLLVDGVMSSKTCFECSYRRHYNDNDSTVKTIRN